MILSRCIILSPAPVNWAVLALEICTWFLTGVCNDFSRVLGLTTTRRPFAAPKDGLFPFTSQWNTLFSCRKTKKTPDFRRNQVFLVIAEAVGEPTTDRLWAIDPGFPPRRTAVPSRDLGHRSADHSLTDRNRPSLHLRSKNYLYKCGLQVVGMPFVLTTKILQYIESARKE